jgi:GNAT superfamily N-acetyltransferase
MATIRPVRPDDYESCAAIATLIRTEPASAADMAADDQEAWASAGVVFHRLVAEDETGRVVGYGFAETSPTFAPGTWNLYAATHPDFRGRCIGSALYEAVEAIARKGGATSAMAWSNSRYEDAYIWAQHRGYVNDLLRTESVLDLSTWDGSRFAGALERVRAQGIRLERYDTLPPEATIRRIMTLEQETFRDVPATEEGESFPGWDEYLRQWVEYTRPRTTVLALDGDRVVGESIAFHPTIPGKGSVTGYTAVLRAYRGRGIALAVKVLTIESAVERGVPRMRTNNDFENPAMLAVNAKLGYQLVPGPRRMKKQF